MSPKIANANQHKQLRRKLFHLIKQQQKIEKKLYKFDYENEIDSSQGGSDVESVILSERYQKLGREIDAVHSQLLQAIP